MRRKLVLGAAMLAVALLGFAAFARISGAAIPGRPLPPLPAEFTGAAPGADSATVARLISRRCGLLAGDPRRKCFEEALLELVRQDRARSAMHTLDLLGQEHEQIRHCGHDYSQVIGMYAWA